MAIILTFAVALAIVVTLCVKLIDKDDKMKLKELELSYEQTEERATKRIERLKERLSTEANPVERFIVLADLVSNQVTFERQVNQEPKQLKSFIKYYADNTKDLTEEQRNSLHEAAGWL